MRISFGILVVFIALLLPAATLRSQTPAPPTFEAVSIKPSIGGPRSGMGTMPGGRVAITNQTVRQIIRNAFGSPDVEVIGGPDWMDTDRWDINATAGRSDSDAFVPQMLKAMLTERFMLQAHIESRERPIYVLLLARADRRLGPNIHASQASALCPANVSCGTQTSAGGSENGSITGTDRSMADFAKSLAFYTDRRVIDRTGLEGRYDFELKWSEISVFTALQEQFGLKLESTRGPIDVVVVERVERPTEN